MSTRSILFGYSLVVVGVALNGPAGAASFDCAKAATPTEHAICDNPQLSSLDEQTAGLYYTYISSGAPPAKVNEVKAAQASFLQRRNACGANYNA